jgi:hypothetical protein
MDTQSRSGRVCAHRYLLLAGGTGGLLDADHIPALFGVELPALGGRPLHALATGFVGGVLLVGCACVVGWTVGRAVKWLVSVRD